MTETNDRGAELARMVRAHAGVLYRVAYSVVRQREDAEDAVQDALVKLLRAAELPAMADERGFLARVVWRAALDRKARRREAQAEDGAELRVVDERRGPAEAAAEADERALLEQWIAELEPELREALVLCAIEGLSSREVGDVLGIAEGTVRTRAMRARTALRERWEQVNRRGRVEVAAAERRVR